MVGRISNHKDLRRRPWKNLWENTQSRKSLPFDGYWHRGDCQLGRGQKAWRLQLSALAARKMENLSTISYDVVPTIQRRMLRLCDCLLLQGTITWGATVWSSLSNPITTYESTKGSSTFFIRQGKVMWFRTRVLKNRFPNLGLNKCGNSMGNMEKSMQEGL